MYTRIVKKSELTKEQEAFIRQMLDDLWVIEKPFLEHIALHYGGHEGLLDSAFSKLEDIVFAYVGETIVGFIANNTGVLNEVDKLVIHSDHRGQGYGRRLIEVFKSISPEPIFVIVTPGNAAARRFYKSAGFTLKLYEEEGEYPYILATMEDALVSY